MIEYKVSDEIYITLHGDKTCFWDIVQKLFVGRLFYTPRMKVARKIACVEIEPDGLLRIDFEAEPDLQHCRQKKSIWLKTSDTFTLKN